MLFFISCLAETNRAPFDLPEAEAELVAGYNVEYSSMGFALFFLGEYANMIVMSSLCVIFFLGGWLPPLDIAIFYWIPGSFWFAIKVTAILFLYIWVRACYPRYRYDQLMGLGWKVFLPLSLAWVVFVSGVLLSFDWLPSGLVVLFYVYTKQTILDRVLDQVFPKDFHIQNIGILVLIQLVLKLLAFQHRNNELRYNL